MAEKLKHLPTKPTSVHSTEKKPFVRLQHFQPNKETPQGERGSSEQPDQKKSSILLLKKREMAGKIGEADRERSANLTPEERMNEAGHYPTDSEGLRGAESELWSGMHPNLKEGDMKRIVGGNMNVTYCINPGERNAVFYKPQFGYDMISLRPQINGNYHGREALAYEMSKLLGTDGLVPPTAVYHPKIEPKEQDSRITEDTIGSAQLSAYTHGEKYHELKDVQEAFNINETSKYDDLLGSVDNMPDVMAFDFIIGNTDRHGLNFFVGEKKDGGMQAIAIDHGLSFPDADADKIGKEYGWTNTINTWKGIVRSDIGSNSIGDKFQEGILKFDNESFISLAKKHGMSDNAIGGVITRVNAIKEHTAQKYIDLKKQWSMEDFQSESEYEGFMKQRSKITPYDIAQICEKKFKTILV